MLRGFTKFTGGLVIEMVYEFLKQILLLGFYKHNPYIFTVFQNAFRGKIS